MSFFRPRIRRIGEGRYLVDLDDDERALLGHLVESLRDAIVGGPSDATRRLFPPGYANDPAREAEYRELIGDSLLEKHLADLDVLETSAAATELDEDGINAWMGAINSMRLVLGTTLDVTEDLDLGALDADDPRIPGLAVYQLLTQYLGELVHALAEWHE
jgi:hypothetical protein